MLNEKEINILKALVEDELHKVSGKRNKQYTDVLDQYSMTLFGILDKLYFMENESCENG